MAGCDLYSIESLLGEAAGDLYFLLRTRAFNLTRLFCDWFGSRGLATALFVLLVAEELNHEYGRAVIVLAINAM